MVCLWGLFGGEPRGGGERRPYLRLPALVGVLAAVLYGVALFAARG
jgi:hypothetical protein